jgi:hypothetical protein
MCIGRKTALEHKSKHKRRWLAERKTRCAAALALTLSQRARGHFAEADGKGFEPISNSSGNQGDSDESGAESGARGAQIKLKDPDLGAIIDAWPTLPEPIKAGILAMVRTASGTK